MKETRQGHPGFHDRSKGGSIRGNRTSSPHPGHGDAGTGSASSGRLGASPCVPKRAALVLAAVFAVAIHSACSGGPETRDETKDAARRARNVVLVSIDTLRADHLGSYGYSPGASPRLDAFASRAVRFENCLSASGHTLSSHKALLSGRHVASFLSSYSQSGPAPVQQPVDYYQLALTGWPSPPMAQRLGEEGMAAAAFTDGGFMKPQYGFDRGFNPYQSTRLGFAGQRPLAEEWLRSHSDRPFFLFLHAYDVHCPYDPPIEFLRKFEPSCEGRLVFKGHCGKDYFNRMNLNADEREHVRRHYDGGIARADDEVGRFLEFLERNGRFEDTLIIVTSDHGESLGERDFVGHGELYENQLRVPLMIYAPGIAPRVVAVPVAGVDVLPTVIDLLFDRIPKDVDGWSLRGLMQGDVGDRSEAEFFERPRFAAITVNEGRGNVTRLRKLAVQASGFKLICDLESDGRELFDLDNDPHEEKSLSGSGRLEEARLFETAKKQDPGPLRGVGSGAGPGTEPLTPEMREELKALGYVN